MQRSPLVIRHPFQHFKLQATQSICLNGQYQCIADVKKIVRRNAWSNSRKIFRTQGETDHSFVICIGVQLGLKWRLWPSVQRSFDPFHFHISPLHNPNGHGRPTVFHSTLSPSCEALLPSVGIWNVCLQHDPGDHFL